MILSQRCTYAIRLALYLSASTADLYVPTHEISDALGMPASFLAKTAQDLTAAGLLRTKRGPNGGIALSRPPAHIHLADIVHAIDGPSVLLTCILGLPNCGEATPCPLHAEWAIARGRLRHTLAEVSLRDAIVGLADGSIRIADLARGEGE